jgi:hypothetical protein
MYAVHNDWWGHTGAGMSFGQGMALSYSWKHKINTKSSTEAELVAGWGRQLTGIYPLGSLFYGRPGI